MSLKGHFVRLRAIYYTPMTKPLGVNVPGSSTSTIPGSAPLFLDVSVENPIAVLAKEFTEDNLQRLPFKALRELVGCIQVVSGSKQSKSGNKKELIKRILTSAQKETALQRFLIDKDIQENRKTERIPLKLFASLRGALRQVGMKILRELHLPYSMPALEGDKLPGIAHRPGECPDQEHPCMLCRVFGSLQQASIFQVYTPPLMDDPDQKADTHLEVNHVLIRTHARNVHRPEGDTLNFNQQYFAGTFTTYLIFPKRLPDPIELGFLINCLERCTDVGAAKAWGAGKLFLQSYALEKVKISYSRVWTDDAFQLTRHETVTPLKSELEQAFATYQQWVAQMSTEPRELREVEEGEVIV